ncbi:hypothetical protein GAN17_00870 [Mycobacterium kubicae]|uniref:hypothetical protein n=1 Tax=Mycobacterium kubicae TaxID=120959 RepID=UPI001640E496|nr:hypothetical protein [Mycobacterium kubicae]QNI05017.1 hypothetical protein GAN17_00870 [Mycobacterium kubicae]
MSAKHRMNKKLKPKEQGPNDSRARGKTSRSGMAFEVVSATVVCAASLIGLAANAVELEGSKDVSAAISPEPPQVSQPVSQEGTVIAVSPNSVTARSINGYIQTYFVTADTTVITMGGRQPAQGAPHLTVNDEVDIVGTIQNGRALATAVAHHGVGHGEAPPMDYVAGQNG